MQIKWLPLEVVANYNFMKMMKVSGLQKTVISLKSIHELAKLCIMITQYWGILLPISRKMFHLEESFVIVTVKHFCQKPWLQYVEIV